MQRYVKKLKVFINMGYELRSLSSCKRLKVSAMIFPTDCSAIYSIGYNSPPCGISNDNCSNEAGACGCVHAEANAIIKLNYDLKTKCLMYSHTMPCIRCASMIINCHQIVGLIWLLPYRNNIGKDLLHEAGMMMINGNELEMNPDNEQILKYWKEL